MVGEKVRKDTLLTVRMTSEEYSKLDYLSDRFEKSQSDMLSRVCKYFVGSSNGEYLSDEERGEVLKTQKVNAIITGELADSLSETADKYGSSVSNVVRNAIKDYYRHVK